YNKFAFPPTAKYSLFGSTRIGHLDINRNLPISLNEANLEHLTTLLSGCTIDQISIYFDKETITNLKKVPEFLGSIHAKRVEFVLEMRPDHNMMLHFMADKLVTSGLVKSGVRKISLSG
ncbi:hypothetical protein PENTCL1PPCAC_16284, partial [Pristionchus entomophagus]